MLLKLPKCLRHISTHLGVLVMKGNTVKILNLIVECATSCTLYQSNYGADNSYHHQGSEGKHTMRAQHERSSACV